MEPEPPTDSSKARRNYFAFLFEGGFFVFGMGFVSVQTLLPALILKEGGSSWLAALMPSIMVIGLFGVPLINAGWVDRLNRLKPFALTTGFFQRVVYILVGLLLVFGSFSSSGIVWLLALAPLASGLLGGFGFSAWQRLYMGGVPASKRASNLAYRFLFGGLGGILAGFVIERTLNAQPGAVGYGLLHLYAGFFLFLSYATFALVVEPHAPHRQSNPSTAEKGSYRSFIKSYYKTGQTRQSRTSFVIGLFAMHGLFVVTPFYATTLLERLQQPASFLGILALWQMVGQSAGNLTAAWIGDKWGGRATFAFGICMVIFTIIPAPFITTVTQAKIAYAAFFFGTMLVIVGKDTLLMEMAPETGQSRYLSLMAGTTMVALLISAILSKILWSYLGGFPALVVFCVVSLVFTFVYISIVKDPRGTRIPPLRAIRRGILRAMR